MNIVCVDLYSIKRLSLLWRVNRFRFSYILGKPPNKTRAEQRLKILLSSVMNTRDAVVGQTESISRPNSGLLTREYTIMKFNGTYIK